MEKVVRHVRFYKGNEVNGNFNQQSRSSNCPKDPIPSQL